MTARAYEDRVFNLDEMLGDAAPPPADFVVEGYLERATHMLLCGRGGLAKTMFLNQLCAAACSPEFPYDLGLEVRGQRIVWFDAEMGEQGTKRRYWDTKLRSYLDERITYINAAGLDLTLKDDYDFVRSSIDGADLVVIDSLRRLTRAAVENSSDEMSAVVTDISDLAHDLGPGILTIHHQGGDPHKWFRGSTAIFDACDSLVGWLPHTFDGEDDKLRRLAAQGTWAKVRHGKEPPDRWFRQTDSGLLVPEEAPEQVIAGKWDAVIREHLPFDGTKKALAEACGTNSRNNAWSDAYDRTARYDPGPKTHIAVGEEPGI